MTSFEAKICCKRQRKRENKNNRSIPFPTGQRTFQKSSKKIKKIKKFHYDFISGQNMLEMAEKEKK